MSDFLTKAHLLMDLQKAFDGAFWIDIQTNKITVHLNDPDFAKSLDQMSELMG